MDNVSPATARRGTNRVVGLLFWIAALALHKGAVERIVASDGHLQTPAYAVAIGVFQVFLALVGLWLVSGISQPDLSRGARRLVTAGLAAAIAVGLYGNLLAARIIDPNADSRRAWDDMVASEELILELGKDLGHLTTSAKNLSIPDHLSRDIFADQVEVTDLETSAPDEEESLESVAVMAGHWPVEAMGSTRREDLNLLRPLLDGVDFFDHAKFFIIRGRFLDDTKSSYEADVGFKALATLLGGDKLYANAHTKFRWVKRDVDGEERFLVDRIDIENFATESAEKSLFAETLDTALTGKALANARRSIHEELVVQSIVDGPEFEKPDPWFYLAAVDRHPGLAVADVDGDGHDDIYLMERHTTNMLFRNRGDGTFEESASTFGLDIEDYTAAAIFADFDNDGDLDGVLGRTLERSMYLENRDGRFVDASDGSGTALPFFASSVNAVDYDNDGLLDLYFSTYAAQMVNSTEKHLPEAFANYLGPEEIREMEGLLDPSEMGNKRANYPGPPNILLKNAGNGRFVRADDALATKVYRNTYQSTWADYDNDGDADVYLANDFAPNNLIRNDGNGQFTDVTEETSTADIGFGMGASWADYDDDGFQDLYVSNMFSKAGRRITEQVGSVDPRFAQMARGNSLFKNSPEGFEKVSGMASPSLLVEEAGWSWGSQFMDVNNDGFQDILALSGHYTAPKAVDAQVDI